MASDRDFVEYVANQAGLGGALTHKKMFGEYALYLNGTVIDNLQENPPGVTVTWSKVSGPGTVTFANAHAIDTSATISVSGVYVLRLTANDGTHVNSDYTTVIVNAANPSASVSESWTGATGAAWPSQWTRQNISGTPPTINTVR